MVLGAYEGSVKVINERTNTVTNSFTVPPYPQRVAFNPTTDTLYVTGHINTVSVITGTKLGH